MTQDEFVWKNIAATHTKKMRVAQSHVVTRKYLIISRKDVYTKQLFSH